MRILATFILSASLVSTGASAFDSEHLKQLKVGVDHSQGYLNMSGSITIRSQVHG